MKWIAFGVLEKEIHGSDDSIVVRKVTAMPFNALESRLFNQLWERLFSRATGCCHLGEMLTVERLCEKG